MIRSLSLLRSARPLLMSQTATTMTSPCNGGRTLAAMLAQQAHRTHRHNFSSAPSASPVIVDSFDASTSSLKQQDQQPQDQSASQAQGEIKAACGTLPNPEEEEEEEQEEMFVDPYHSFEHSTREWGGPRRGGRLPEPTRFGDWERKGRCSDF